MSTYLVPFKKIHCSSWPSRCTLLPAHDQFIDPSSLTHTSVSSAHQPCHLLSIFHLFGPVAVPLLLLLWRSPLICRRRCLPLLTPHNGQCVHLIQSTVSAQAVKALFGTRSQYGTLCCIQTETQTSQPHWSRISSR